MKGAFRRGILGGGAAVALAPIAEAAVPCPAPHPDAALLAACAEFVRLEALVNAALRGLATLEDQDAADEEVDRLCAMQDPHAEIIFTRACRTLDGARAVFLACMGWTNERADDDPNAAPDRRIRAAAHRAALAGLGA